MLRDTDKLDWYIILDGGFYVGYTNNEYIASEYKNRSLSKCVSILCYESRTKEDMDEIICNDYGFAVDELCRVRPLTTPNKRLIVLTSIHWIDDCRIGVKVCDTMSTMNDLLLALYNIADFLEYFPDGDRLLVMIKILIIKYIRPSSNSRVDKLYLLANTGLIPVIKHLKEDL